MNTSLLFTIGSAILWALVGIVYWIGYRRGKTDTIEQQREIDERVEHDREQRDAELRQLSDDELDRRLDRWMREHSIDPRR